MADNFLETSEEKEFPFSYHPVASKALELLIYFCSPDNFEKFTKVLTTNLRLLVNDSSASFVLEACVKTATLRALSVKQEKLEEPEDEPSNKKRKFTKVSSNIDYNLKLDIKHANKLYCQQFVSSVSRFLLNNLESYLYENNANHLLRSCLCCLAGTLSQKNRFQKIEVVQIVKEGCVVSDEWNEILGKSSALKFFNNSCNNLKILLGDYAERLMSWPQFPDLAFDEASSICLQSLCQALHNLECHKSVLKKLIKAIMRKSFKDDDEAADEEPKEQKVFSCSASLHLLETIMASCDEKTLNKIYKRNFKEKLVEHSESSSLNFSVQRLIDAMTDKETFDEIFNTLAPSFNKLFQIGHTGVVLSVVKACERLGVKQGQFIQSLLKALECAGENTSKCIMPIITLTPLNISGDSQSTYINLHGSLILQQIFQFNKPIKIVQSLLDMKPQDIADIFCDDKGSRIADAYLESKFIGEKSREKMTRHLEGMFLNLAVSRSGSHVLEKIYNLATEVNKEMIVKELSGRLNQLNGSVSGRILNYKFSVEAYARNPNQWKSFLARKSTKH